MPDLAKGVSRTIAYKPYFFSQLTVFFSHNKSANGTFSHGLSAKRTGQIKDATVLFSDDASASVHHVLII